MSVVCDRWKAALTAVAAGGAVPPDLEAHLQECGPCREGLADQRQLIGRIDAELRASLRVEPSPAFLARVRQRADRPRAGLPWWRMDRLVSAAIAVVILMAGVVWFAGRGAETPPTQRWRPSDVARVAAPPAPVVPVRPEAVAVTRVPVRRPSAKAVLREEPEVLVPPGQEALVRRLIEPIRTGRVDTASLVSAETTAPRELKARDIEPIEIKPLAIESSNEEES